MTTEEPRKLTDSEYHEMVGLLLWLNELVFQYRSELAQQRASNINNNMTKERKSKIQMTKMSKTARLLRAAKALEARRNNAQKRKERE